MMLMMKKMKMLLSLQLLFLAASLALAEETNGSTRCFGWKETLVAPGVDITDVSPGDASVTFKWDVPLTPELVAFSRDCPPQVHYTVFCKPASSNEIENEHNATTVDYQLGGMTQENEYTLENLTNGLEYNCTVRSHRAYPHHTLESDASVLATPSSTTGLLDEECDAVVAALDAEQLFLGVVDSSSSSEEVEFSWHFPEEIAIECIRRFSIECEELSEDLSSGLRNAASAIQHHVGSLNPAKSNLGQALLKGLSGGLIYSCSLRVRDGVGDIAAASNEVYVEPGYPKLLKDMSKNKMECEDGKNYHLIERGRGIAVRNGCEGVFLLPGDLAIMCASTSESYVECASASGGLPYEGIEVFWQTSIAECVPGESFGFTAGGQMFVMNGCEGQFIAYPNKSGSRKKRNQLAEIKSSEEEEEEEEEEENVVVSCEGDLRQKPAYEQKVKRRRWWCLFVCRTEGDDPNGFYTCPLAPEEE